MCSKSKSSAPAKPTTVVTNNLAEYQAGQQQAILASQQDTTSPASFGSELGTATAPATGS